MSAPQGFAYAQARTQARHGERLREADWQGLETARSAEAYLDRARRTYLHRFTERLDARMDPHAIERRLRAAWRSYVLEIAAWMPQAWRAAVEWCSYLPDLPIIDALLSRRPRPDWATDDPVFAALIESDLPASRKRISPRGRPPFEPLRSADRPIAARWLTHWQALWPGDAARPALASLAMAIESALSESRRSAATAARHRRELAHVFVRHFRRSGGTAAAIFCHLGLVLIDIERVRGAILRRRLFAAAIQRGAP